MEIHLGMLSQAIAAGAIAVFLVYVFALPRLPGVRFLKTPWFVALSTAILQVVGTALILDWVAIAFMYLGYWAGVRGAGLDPGSLILLTLGFAVDLGLCIGFSFVLIVAGEKLSRKSIIFGHFKGRLLCAVVLTIVHDLPPF